MEDHFLWDGQLVCLEFLLTKSIQLRLQHWIGNVSTGHNEELQVSASFVMAADTLLSNFRLSPEAIQRVTQLSRLVQLLLLSGVIGNILYYNDSECESSKGQLRCCPQHRLDGYRLALDLIMAHVKRCPDRSEPFKPFAVVLHSVLVSSNPDAPDEEAAEAFMALSGELGGCTDDLRAKMEDINKHIDAGQYDVDLQLFEQTMYKALRSLAKTIKVPLGGSRSGPSTVIDGVSDLVGDILGGSSISIPSTPSIHRTSSHSTPPVTQIQLADEDAHKVSIPDDLLKEIPGGAFRRLLASDDFFTSVVHRTDPHVSAFVSERLGNEVVVIDEEEIPRFPPGRRDPIMASPSPAKRSKLTDRHDSAQQIPWDSHANDRADANPVRSAVNPAFRTIPGPALKRPKSTDLPPHLTPSTSNNHLISDFPSPTPSPHIHNRHQMRRPWTEAEITNLITGYRRFGTDWRTIQAAYDFGPRTNVDLKDKARNLIKAGRLPPV